MLLRLLSAEERAEQVHKITHGGERIERLKHKYPVLFALARSTWWREAESMPRVASPAAAHIGKLIVDHRQRLGLTQDEVAVLSAIDSSNVRAYESGRAMPSVQSLVRIASALNVEPGELLRDVTPELFVTSAEDGRRRRAK